MISTASVEMETRRFGALFGWLFLFSLSPWLELFDTMEGFKLELFDSLGGRAGGGEDD